VCCFAGHHVSRRWFESRYLISFLFFSSFFESCRVERERRGADGVPLSSEWHRFVVYGFRVVSLKVGRGGGGCVIGATSFSFAPLTRGDESSLHYRDYTDALLARLAVLVFHVGGSVLLE
jgi:hypothetical protein